MYLLVNTVKITNFMQSISLTEEVALDASQVVCPSVKIVLSMLADRDYWGDFPCSLHMNNGTTLFDGTLDKESVEYDYAKDTISFEVVSDIKEIMQKEVSADYGTHYYEYWRDEKTGIVSIYSSRQAALEWLFKWMKFEIPREYDVCFDDWSTAPWMMPFASGKMVTILLSDGTENIIYRLPALKTIQMLFNVRMLYKPGRLKIVGLKSGGDICPVENLALIKKDINKKAEIESLEVGAGDICYIDYSEMHTNLNGETRADNEYRITADTELNSRFDIDYEKLYYEGIVPNNIGVGDKINGDCITKIVRNMDTIESGETYVKIEALRLI